MKATELRIGNYFLYKNRILNRVNTAWLNNLKGCEPILLTEEWLLKFGFDEGSDIVGECYFINEFTPSDVTIYRIDGDLYYMNGSTPIIISYVHQLQNLYFALTGEELTVKELAS